MVFFSIPIKYKSMGGNYKMYRSSDGDDPGLLSGHYFSSFEDG